MPTVLNTCPHAAPPTSCSPPRILLVIARHGDGRFTRRGSHPQTACQTLVPGSDTEAGTGAPLSPPEGMLGFSIAPPAPILPRCAQPS